MKLKLFLATAFLAMSFLAQAQEKQDREVTSFSSIDISGAFKVYIRMGDKSALTVVADSKVINDVDHSVNNGELSVEIDNDWWEWNNDHGNIELYITVTKLSEIDLSGACVLKSKNTLTGSDMSIDASGASKIFLDLSCNTVNLDISGASKVTLGGTCQKFNLEASGASAIYAADLQSKIVNLETSGACKAEVNASEHLDIEASGASQVRYKGNPKVTQDTSGASSVSSM